MDVSNTDGAAQADLQAAEVAADSEDKPHLEDREEMAARRDSAGREVQVGSLDRVVVEEMDSLDFLQAVGQSGEIVNCVGDDPLDDPQDVAHPGSSRWRFNFRELGIC
ncbi:MAG: hypothetical protein Tsb009_12600 [Planctomycetaceae bacterium]